MSDEFAIAGKMDQGIAGSYERTDTGLLPAHEAARIDLNFDYPSDFERTDFLNR
jgi:hypothetical protein